MEAFAQWEDWLFSQKVSKSTVRDIVVMPDMALLKAKLHDVPTIVLLGTLLFDDHPRPSELDAFDHDIAARQRLRTHYLSIAHHLYGVARDLIIFSEWYAEEDSRQTFLENAALFYSVCKIMKALDIDGEVVFSCHEVELAVVCGKSIQTMRKLYDAEAKLRRLDLPADAPLSEAMLGIADLAFLPFEVCVGAGRLLDIQEMPGGMELAVVIWNRHHGISPLLVKYIDVLVPHSTRHKQFARIVTKVFGSEREFASSFVDNIRARIENWDDHFPSLDDILAHSIHPLKFYCNTAFSGYLAIRQEILGLGALRLVMDIFNHLTEWFVTGRHSKSGHDHRASIYGCLELFYIVLMAGDGQRWLPQCIRRGLVPALFSLGRVIYSDTLQDEARRYSNVLCSLTSLARKAEPLTIMNRELIKVMAHEDCQNARYEYKLLEREVFRKELTRIMNSVGVDAIRICCDNPVCRVSGSLPRCGGCKAAHYCSPKCQQEAWILHRKWCRQIALEAPLSRISQRDKSFQTYIALVDLERTVEHFEDELSKPTQTPMHDFAYVVDMNRVGLRTDTIQVRNLKDAKAWSSSPALAEHHRDCALMRLRNGNADQIFIECIHSDGRLRAGEKKAVFYVTISDSWEALRTKTRAFAHARILNTVYDNSLALSRVRPRLLKNYWRYGIPANMEREFESAEEEVRRLRRRGVDIDQEVEKLEHWLMYQNMDQHILPNGITLGAMAKSMGA